MRRAWQRELDNADLAATHYHQMTDLGPVCGAFNIPDEALTTSQQHVTCGRCRDIIAVLTKD